MKHLLTAALLTLAPTDADDWTPLIDEDLTLWEVWTGVPHESVDIEWEGKSKNGREGNPMGLGDPLNIYTTSQHADGDWLLHISGLVYAGLTTKQNYANYHLRAEVKWGEKKFAPRLTVPRDSGILYHCVGEHGTFWNVWKQSLEYQVQENDNGDYFKIGDVRVQIPTKIEEGERRGIFDPASDWLTIGPGQGFSVARSVNLEKPGEWNSVEIYAFGDRAVHISNGQVVNVIRNAEYKDGDTWKPLTSGQIQIQCEAAEVTYRHLQLRDIDAMPAEFARFFPAEE